MAAYIFACREEIARGVEESCAVDSSSSIEEALSFAQAVGQFVENRGVDVEDVFSARWADRLER